MNDEYVEEIKMMAGKLYERLEKRPQDFNEWEKGFIESIVPRTMKRDVNLTINQTSKLFDLYDKIAVL